TLWRLKKRVRKDEKTEGQRDGERERGSVNWPLRLSVPLSLSLSRTLSSLLDYHIATQDEEDIFLPRFHFAVHFIRLRAGVRDQELRPQRAHRPRRAEG